MSFLLSKCSIRKMGKIRIPIIIGMSCLLVFCGCGEEESVECQPSGDISKDPEECRLPDEGYFMLDSMDMHYEYGQDSEEFDAAVIEMPHTGASGYLVLRDSDQNDYRFDPAYDMDWEKQLAGIQLGKTYHFVLMLSLWDYVWCMKIFDKDSLLYLASSATLGRPFALDRGEAFQGTELEDLKYEQVYGLQCNSRKEKGDANQIHLVTNIPMVFSYGEQKLTLYQSQEATLATPYGNFMVHLLRSTAIYPCNYDDGDSGYSFYVKRL